jgi:hypothetical protein
MKPTFLNFSEDGLLISTIPAWCVEVNDTTIVVNKCLQDSPKTIFFKITHNQINTLVDLTDCAPYELWYFNDKELLTGKSFSLQEGSAPFHIQTQARYIALVPMAVKKVKLDLNNRQMPRGSFKLTDTYLPDSAPYSAELAAWTLSLFALSNEELVDTFNKEVQKNGWVQARGYYLGCLKKEIQNRPFDSDILFTKNNQESVLEFGRSKTVKWDKATNKLIHA